MIWAAFLVKFHQLQNQNPPQWLQIIPETELD